MFLCLLPYSSIAEDTPLTIRVTDTLAVVSTQSFFLLGYKEERNLNQLVVMARRREQTGPRQGRWVLPRQSLSHRGHARYIRLPMARGTPARDNSLISFFFFFCFTIGHLLPLAD